ncbi:hypothetical protein CY35_03G132400 [Sphagnum magellanicum]|nr:hypothetical protein CY35_03G132400 [Sphagnum magellanicum]KAH9569424.1 hypothetical protein CY35_03G132400 [Sphagnum magellanicum]
MANPYAIIKCGGQVQRSATAQNQGSRPTWNQTFTFNIEDGATELSVKLYNKNALYDGHIGDTRIQLKDTFNKVGLTTTTWYDVARPMSRNMHGQIELSLKFTPKQDPASDVFKPINMTYSLYPTEDDLKPTKAKQGVTPAAQNLSNSSSDASSSDQFAAGSSEDHSGMNDRFLPTTSTQPQWGPGSGYPGPPVHANASVIGYGYPPADYINTPAMGYPVMTQPVINNAPLVPQTRRGRRRMQRAGKRAHRGPVHLVISTVVHAAMFVPQLLKPRT